MSPNFLPRASCLDNHNIASRECFNRVLEPLLLQFCCVVANRHGCVTALLGLLFVYVFKFFFHGVKLPQNNGRASRVMRRLFLANFIRTECRRPLVLVRQRFSP